jgi:prepilin-type N-terminal cleavage/methylation domain-containing protein
MKLSSSKVQNLQSRSGFSLVEMIGVLAIIAILAVIIVPKVFSTIASSRVTNAATSVNGVKTAVAEFFGKYGMLPTTAANSRIDDLLVAAGMLENRFLVKIGNQPTTQVAGGTWARTNGVWANNGAGADQTNQSRIICVASNTTNPATAAGANFRLDGATNLTAGSRVVSAAIVNVTAAEARELSLRIDGEAFTAVNNTAADANGKVVYAAPVNGMTTAYVYIAHQ